MSARVLPILAGQVLRDAARERVFHTVLLYGLGLALLGPWVADLTLAAPGRAVVDLGLTSAWLVASGVAIWLGVRAIGWELRSRSAALVLSGPVSRWTWLMGRALGVGIAMGLEVIGLTGGFVAVVALRGIGLEADLLWFLLLLWGECVVVAGLAGLFGVLVRPGLAAACVVGLWVAGHLAQEYAAVTGGGWLAHVLFTVVPDLDAFNVQAQLVHAQPIPALRGLGALGYAGLWAVGLLALTGLVVQRRDVA